MQVISRHKDKKRKNGHEDGKMSFSRSGTQAQQEEQVDEGLCARAGGQVRSIKSRRAHVIVQTVSKEA